MAEERAAPPPPLPPAEAPAAPAPAAARRKLSGYDWWRENLEAIVVAFILALIIRHFSVEAFEIPTGSMAPTLYGIHARSSCPNCDTALDMGLRTDSSTQAIEVEYQIRPVFEGACPECGLATRRAFEQPTRRGDTFLEPGRSVIECDNQRCGHTWTPPSREYEQQAVLVRLEQRYPRLRQDLLLQCPICWFRYHDVITQSNRRGGDKILVNKFAFRIGEPKRWDVIVFHFDEGTNYIKRLIGLPGETVLIEGGDLYAGPDREGLQIARKIDRPDARDSLWIKISDSDVIERGYSKDAAWREVFERGSGLDSHVAGGKWWSFEADPATWTVNVTSPPGRVACLLYNRPCVNFYPYGLLSPISNLPRSDPPEEVGDKKVAFTVRPSGVGEDPWIGGEIRDGDFTYQFRLPVGEASDANPAVLQRMPTDDSLSPSPSRQPLEQRATAPISLPLEEPTRVEFENVDDRVAVLVDGVVVLVLEYERDSPRLDPEEHSLHLLAGGVGASFESIEVYRDVYYTEAGSYATHAPLAIGSDEDGAREYFACGDHSPSSHDGRAWGTVPGQNMMGKAFVVFWPALPWNWRCRFIH